MPCLKCGNTLIVMDEEEVCPKCRGLSVLDADSAIKVATRLVSLATKIFNEELKKWERDTLLGNLVARRELSSRQFFREHSVLNVGRLTELTLLIKRASEFASFRGKTPLDPDEVNKLVDTFHDLMQFENTLLDIKAGLRNVLRLEKFDVTSFTLQDVSRKIRIVQNEKSIIKEKIFAGYNVYPEEKAEQEFAKLNEGKPVDMEERKNELLPPQRFIRKYYKDFIVPLFALFHRDRVSAECFQLDYLEEILDEPNDLLKFIDSNFPLFEDDTLTVSPIDLFVEKASKYFGVTKSEAERLLVFDANNRSICPIFVRFRNEKLGDCVFISKDFCRFIYTILHSIITEDLFNKETVKLSKEFENEKVKAEFEKNGYIYFPDVPDKKKATLQIDGLAIKNKKCYVVECKGIRLKRLIDEPDTLNYTIRDLEGYVLGKEYSTNKDGQPVERDKPSLIRKLDFVKQNIRALGQKYGFDADINEFEGVIVTISHPPINEFKGVKILSIDQISGLG